MLPPGLKPLLSIVPNVRAEARTYLRSKRKNKCKKQILRFAKDDKLKS
jgi:hypothetical protein